MTTLILGCGYLGRRVGRLLHRRGDRVLGTARSPARAAELPAWGIEPVLADVLDPASLDRLPEADRIFYSVGFDRSAGVSMRHVYLDGLRCVLDHLHPGVHRLVYASSTGVYGQDDGGWVDEEAPTEPRHESGRVVLEAERLLRASARVPVILLRFAGLYGPGRIVRRAAVAAGEPIPGDPRRFLNLIHIEDAASAAVAALERGEPEQVYNISDDRPVERGEYYERLTELIGAPPPRF
ncbi:MAG: SDR family oxidoreductase, partial [Isosphaeraceae bacterium]|nr:SDR family oxidoreductase [Isosphaeraceae bacterium]